MFEDIDVDRLRCSHIPCSALTATGHPTARIHSAKDCAERKIQTSEEFCDRQEIFEEELASMSKQQYHLRCLGNHPQTLRTIWSRSDRTRGVFVAGRA
ncbi:hypothetical protein M438DRAFT_195696 [Aureobasidium pullulans EXF-150]|uniref:Uncharacterized protein n=1 Tax=Aureobasidium pullulans EXF-150 TaxID=1043002 RepID=A0A074XTY8_AURPU|nr:uncharacterized protein M438DRAFT_195696 [Aureobasidium pullulans EXF-150]KEQ85437.1 hypothetical protein M438DRAFT_195696 [Aureobasidium pullulans EXF-150]